MGGWSVLAWIVYRRLLESAVNYILAMIDIVK